MQNYEEKLEELKQNACFRAIKNIEYKTSKYIVVEGKKMLNLSSNDYLNLSTDEDLKLEFIEKYKNNPEFLFSSASARLLTGTSNCYKKLENNFAKLFNKEGALLFNTGYQANQGVISALFSKGDCIFCDKLNHASIVSGLKLSQAEHFRYKHNDYDNLEKLLKEKRAKYNRAIIVSESVFSMDGDISDIDKLIELKNKYNCLLMIDEAHAFCACGRGLAGLSEGKDVDIITATFGKAVGSFGAFCVANRDIINYLINKARSFIFSTSIPPINIAWSNWLLTEKRDYLLNQKQKLEIVTNQTHKILGKTVSNSQIIPIIIGTNENTLKISEKLRSEGYYIPAIRPPTVPEGTSRLRISLTADSRVEDIENVLKIIHES